MRHILISIKPEYIRKIFNKEKTLEIRTTCPADWKKYLIDSSMNKMFSKGYSKPDDCIVHMYCTKGQELWGDGTGDTWYGIAEDEDIERVFELNPTLARLNGKVVGEFTLKEIEQFELQSDLWKLSDEIYNKNQRIQKQSCVPFEKLVGYLNRKTGYAWHIDDLKIYDKPKELSDFETAIHCFQCKNTHITKNCFGDYVGDYYKNKFCHICKYYNHDFEDCDKTTHLLTRPPQSWCYVELI